MEPGQKGGRQLWGRQKHSFVPSFSVGGGQCFFCPPPISTTGWGSPCTWLGLRLFQCSMTFCWKLQTCILWQPGVFVVFSTKCSKRLFDESDCDCYFRCVFLGSVWQVWWRLAPIYLLTRVCPSRFRCNDFWSICFAWTGLFLSCPASVSLRMRSVVDTRGAIGGGKGDKPPFLDARINIW